jgi:S1-C subfamily serine protease
MPMKNILGIIFTLMFIIFLIGIPDQPKLFEPSPIALMRTVTPHIVAYDKYGKRMWSASGIWIDKRNCLTAAHVIGDTKGPIEELPSYWMVGKHRATMATIDTVHDSAMLTIDDNYYGPVATLSKDRLVVGDEIVMCGWVTDIGLETTWGRISNLRGRVKSDGDIICDISCTYGASGGPVFHDGKVIGLVSHGIPGFLTIEPCITFGLEVR